MTQIEIREFQYPADYDRVIDLWNSAGSGVHVGPSDTPQELQKKLKRDPDLFLVAASGEEIVGSAIGGFDGRRGMIYHVAVAPAHRRQGLATRLMREIEERLRAKGCIKCYLLVFPDNADAIEFYKQIGWNVMSNVIFAKEFSVS